MGTSVESNREQYKHFLKKQEEERSREKRLEEIEKSKKEVKEKFNKKRELFIMIEKMNNKEIEKCHKFVKEYILKP